MELCRSRRLTVLDPGGAEATKGQDLSGTHQDGLRVSADAQRGTFDAANRETEDASCTRNHNNRSQCHHQGGTRPDCGMAF